MEKPPACIISAPPPPLIEANYCDSFPAAIKVTMRSMTGERLDLTDDPHGTRNNREQRRRFVGVHFVCCDAYARVYINRGQTAYEGHCPKCAKKVRLGIGPGGTDSRFFTAG